MNEEMKETVYRLAEYSSAEKQRDTRFVRVYFILGILALIANAVLNAADAGPTFWTGFWKGVTFSTALVAMAMGILYTTGAMIKINAFKKRLLNRNKEARP